MYPAKIQHIFVFCKSYFINLTLPELNHNSPRVTTITLTELDLPLKPA